MLLSPPIDMPGFTKEEYIDMHFAYRLCDDNSPNAENGKSLRAVVQPTVVY